MFRAHSQRLAIEPWNSFCTLKEFDGRSSSVSLRNFGCVFWEKNGYNKYCIFGGRIIIETLSRAVWVVVVVYYEYDPFSLFVLFWSVCLVLLMIGGDHHWLQSIWLAFWLSCWFIGGDAEVIGDAWSSLLIVRFRPCHPQPLNYICWQTLIFFSFASFFSFFSLFYIRYFCCCQLSVWGKRRMRHLSFHICQVLLRFTVIFYFVCV